MVIRCFNMGCPTWKYSFWAIDKSYDRFWRLVPNMHWCSDGSYWILWIYCSPIIGAYVPEHIWLPYQNKSLILHLEPRDTWCLRWGLTPGIGRFVYIRKAFTALYFLALRIVDAPWVRLCTSSSFQSEVGWNYYIYILRGVVYHCSFYCIGLWSASKSGMSR